MGGLTTLRNNTLISGGSTTPHQVFDKEENDE